MQAFTEDFAYGAASPADLPAVRSLLQGCALPAEDLTAAHLAYFIVCRCGEGIVGAVGLEPFGDVALLRSLAVAPELRGRRLGHGLWTRVRDDVVRMGISRLYLLTTTADGLFSRWGFQHVARDLVPEAIQATSEYSALCPSTATVMAMDIAPGVDQRVS